MPTSSAKTTAFDLSAILDVLDLRYSRLLQGWDLVGIKRLDGGYSK
jgi:hypothetical protein